MRRSLSGRGTPTFRNFGQQPQAPSKPDLKNVRIHSLPESTVLELVFKDGMTLTLAFPPDQAEKLGQGLIEGSQKSRHSKPEQKT